MLNGGGTLRLTLLSIRPLLPEPPFLQGAA